MQASFDKFVMFDVHASAFFKIYFCCYIRTLPVLTEFADRVVWLCCYVDFSCDPELTILGRTLYHDLLVLDPKFHTAIALSCYIKQVDLMKQETINLTLFHSTVKRST